MKGHFHTDAGSIFLGAVGVFIVAHVMRVISAKLGASSTPMLASTGKAVGGFFTLD